MSIFEAIILAIVEGLTEFLPVSSTGHLILTSAIMGIENESFVQSFNIIVQFGAILSVLVLYWKKFLPNLEFYKKVLIGFLPAAVIGLLVKNQIDAVLGSVLVVAFALIVGGIVLIYVDKKIQHQQNTKTIDTLSLKECLLIGLIQCFAFIPGVSRSASTIIGGLYFKMTKKEAAEFSYYLAVPTLAGATFIKSLKIWPTILPEQIQILIIGCVVAFIVATIAIKAFIHLVSTIGFKGFGIYRIVVGTIILIIYFTHGNLQYV